MDTLATDEAAPGKIVAREKNGTRVLDLTKNGEWRRPLLSNSSQSLFVSVLLYGSLNSEVHIGNARLRFGPSPVKGSLQLEAMRIDPRTKAMQWRALGIHAPMDLYDGRGLAAMPVLTVRLDRAANEWDLFSGMRPIEHGLAMVGDVSKGPDTLIVRAGDAGTMLCGLVQSLDNPLYEDANANGIDDQFEQQKRGVLLPLAAGSAERATLASEWRNETRTRPVSAMLVERPRPDGM